MDMILNRPETVADLPSPLAGCKNAQTENASGASGVAVLEEAIARSGDDRISGFEEHRELPAVRLLAGLELGRIGGDVRFGARGGIALEVESDDCGNASRAVIRQIPQGLRSVFDSVVFQMNHHSEAFSVCFIPHRS